MFTLTFNGKPFDTDDFQDALMEAAVNESVPALVEGLSGGGGAGSVESIRQNNPSKGHHRREENVPHRQS